MDSPDPTSRASKPWPVLREIDVPSRLWIPISRDSSVRRQGTHVAAGEALVEDAGDHALIPIAPAAGVIGSTAPATLTDGRAVLTLELTTEGGIPPSEPTEANIPLAQSALSLWIDHFCESGLNIHRHESPDLIGQLRATLVGPVDTIVCSVLDTDGALHLSAALAAEHAKDVVAALELLSKITGATKVYVATEANAESPWPDPLPKAAEGTGITVVPLINAYPQADPTLLLYSLIERRLSPGDLPTAQGALLIDAATAIAIAQAQAGVPMLRVPVGIHNHVAGRTYFLSVPIGTRVTTLLESCGILPEQKILRGGDFLRDLRLGDDTIISGAELVIHITPMELPENPDPCIRSGWCIEVCPTRVHPAKILDAAQRQDPAMAHRAGIHACIECGLCTHVCPSRLPLLQAIRQMRGNVEPAS